MPATLERKPLLADPSTSRHVHRQVSKFLEKRNIEPGDVSAFHHRTGLRGEHALRHITYDKTPKGLTYERPAKRPRDDRTPRFHPRDTDLDPKRTQPMARTLRFMQRAGMAVGGRHDSGAHKVGYYRMSFHPKDDEAHGAPAAERSRLLMKHIVKHFPEMPMDHYKDRENDGSHTHHIEIPHHAIPDAIRHLAESLGATLEELHPAPQGWVLV